MLKLFAANAFANLLVLASFAIIVWNIMERGTFLGVVYALPLLIWASYTKFRVAHTVVINSN